MDPIRAVPYQALIQVFESDGFRFKRTVGDHLIYSKPGISRPLVIPMYRAVPVFIIKGLLRTAGMSRERYLVLLAYNPPCGVTISSQ
jgi:predicted RNA binding protein YcfA (HicA-like mRNA interferase family)